MYNATKGCQSNTKANTSPAAALLLLLLLALLN
jgi:uncharacterized protein (TIGR03382 family)